MKKQVLFTILIVLPLVAMADDSGKCGASLTWTYIEATKTLTISGTGEMTDYDYSNFSIYSPWHSYSDDIVKVSIGEGVTSIGDAAFVDCTSLTSIEIPNSVTSIGEGAFSICTGLTSVTIGNSVKSIEHDAFYGCDHLSKVIVSDIAAWCGIKFDGNVSANPLSYAKHLYSDEITEIKDLVIPNSVTSIGVIAFYNCSGLISVTIPNSVTSIGERAFYQCSDLTSVTIPNSVTSIGQYAFSGCKGLTSIEIPNSMTSIGERAFYGCYFTQENFINNTNLTSSNNWGAIISDEETTDGLLILGNIIVKCRPWATSVTIPNSVTSIGKNAFSGCTGLTSIVIPNSVTTIGDYAFHNCTGPTSIEIPNSVTSIGRYAFHNCTGLTSVTIGNSVTSIGDFAFWYCSDLTSVTIGNSVTSIGQQALDGCAQLKSITIHCNRPPSTTNAITSQEVYEKCTLYVPEGSENAYYVADGWKNFKTIKTIAAEEKVPQDVNGDGIVDTQDVLEIYKYIQEH